jgi:hypothetical protein
MNITIKEMKLVFQSNGDTWDKLVYTIDDNNIVFEQRGIKVFPELMTTEYFDDWETQMKNIPTLNIVQVERFI